MLGGMKQEETKTRMCSICSREFTDDGWSTCHECIVTASKAIELMTTLGESLSRNDKDTSK